MKTRGDLSRLLMTTDAVGGVWNYSLELCRGLAARGISVTLAVMGPRPSGAQRAAVAQLNNVTVCESDFRLEWMPEPWGDLALAGEWLLDLEREFQADVVHLNGYVHATLAWRAPVVVVAHSCVLSWWRSVRGEPAPAEWNRYRQSVRDGLAAADLVIAPTRAMLDTLQENYGAFNHTRVIPNGIDSTRFSPLAKEPFVLSVGRVWDEAKNIAALASAATDIAWPVRVVGEITPPDGTAPRVLRTIDALGPRPSHELTQLYGRAAVYALPARYEPFGLSALEAALSGCALVLGDIPSLREVWGEAAWFVSPDDPAGLRFALRQLIARPDLCAEYALRARQRAAAFTARRMTNAYLQSYTSLLTPAASPHAPASLPAFA